MNLEEITYQGGYIRTITMITLEFLIKQHNQAIKEQQALTQNTLDFIEGMERVILLLLDINYDRRFDKASMPYGDAHRVKVRAWQTLVVVLDFLDPQATYSNRELIAKHTGRDIIADVNNLLWKVISLNHLPSVRAYIEIVVIRFSLTHPELSIQDPHFVKTLLDPNIKATIASSFLVIAGFVMTKLSSQGAIVLKQKLLEHMSGFLTSNGAHVRCVAQYFMH